MTDLVKEARACVANAPNLASPAGVVAGYACDLEKHIARLAARLEALEAAQQWWPERMKRILRQARAQYDEAVKGLPHVMVSNEHDLFMRCEAYSTFMCTMSVLTDALGTSRRVVWEQFVEQDAPPPSAAGEPQQ